MKRYIDKDRILAELKKIIKEAPSRQCSWEEGYYCGLCRAESIIDTCIMIDTYEEKYKGALARCKWLLSNGMISKIAATDMFRELMDNDENIRKEIINIFHSLAEGKIPVDINYADIFTWLEKQGEQKPTLPKWKYKKDNTTLLKDSLVLNKCGHMAKLSSGAIVSDVWMLDYDELAKLPKEELKKQGEQEVNEPDWCHHKVDLSDCSEEYRKAYYDGWNNCNQQHSQCNAEQKPAWSEEDERNLNDAILFIETGTYSLDKDNLINWFKSLKQRIGG